MNTFPIRSDEYSVEEISYDDMMLILASQKPISSDLESDMSKTISANDSDTYSSNKPLVNTNNFSQRISENANKQLPDWLLNN